MTTTAQIAAKGCSSTGISEQLAETLHANLGRKVIAVVELVAEARTENRNGDEKVVPNQLTEDYLRNLQRAFYYERKVGEDGPRAPPEQARTTLSSGPDACSPAPPTTEHAPPPQPSPPGQAETGEPTA